MLTEQEIRRELNQAALKDPQVGDRWHEMYSVWCYVVWRESNKVVWCGSSAPCTFPQDAVFYVGTIEDWVEHMTYGTNDETVMWLADRRNDVSWWLDETSPIKAYSLGVDTVPITGGDDVVPAKTERGLA